MHNQQLFVYLFLLTGVMSSANNSENEMSSVEAAHSTTSSYDDEGKYILSHIAQKMEK